MKIIIISSYMYYIYILKATQPLPHGILNFRFLIYIYSVCVCMRVNFLKIKLYSEHLQQSVSCVTGWVWNATSTSNSSTKVHNTATFNNKSKTLTNIHWLDANWQIQFASRNTILCTGYISPRVCVKKTKNNRMMSELNQAEHLTFFSWKLKCFFFLL